MAKLIIIPEEDYNVVKKYLPSSGFPDSVVLVPETVIKGSDFPAETAAKLRELDGQPIDYDFGGEADLFVDIITDKDHYALASLGLPASDEAPENK